MNSNWLMGAYLGTSAINSIFSAIGSYSTAKFNSNMAAIQAGYQQSYYNYQNAVYGVQYAAQRRAAQIANAQADYQASLLLSNASALAQDAEYAREIAADQAAQKAQAVRQFVGTQRAAMSATGVVVDSGSYMHVVEDTEEAGQADVLAILYAGDVSAWRSEVQATYARNQAELMRSSKVDLNLASVYALVRRASVNFGTVSVIVVGITQTTPAPPTHLTPDNIATLSSHKSPNMISELSYNSRNTEPTDS